MITIAKLITSFIVSITLIIGSAAVGLIIKRLLLDFTDYPEHLIKVSAPIIFLLVAYLCAKNTRIG